MLPVRRESICCPSRIGSGDPPTAARWARSIAGIDRGPRVVGCAGLSALYRSEFPQEFTSPHPPDTVPTGRSCPQSSTQACQGCNNAAVPKMVIHTS